MITFYRRMPKFEYISPKTQDELLSLLSKFKSKAKVFAGGTDLIPKLRGREVPIPEYVVDLKSLRDLNYIAHTPRTGLAIGALATISDVESSPLIREKFNILSQAAESMASVQVRNRGTVAGNICSAVPSADMAPALLTLEAKVKLVSARAERVLTMEEFITGVKTTATHPDEFLAEIRVPDPPAGSKGIYLKLMPRGAMDLAVVGVAVLANIKNGTCNDIRIGLGAVSPTPVRARNAENLLKGKKLSEKLIEEASELASAGCCPISDHRASAEYRTDMVRVLTSRAIRKLASN